eukprot:2683899-Amphidinium_carterae.1
MSPIGQRAPSTTPCSTRCTLLWVACIRVQSVLAALSVMSSAEVNNFIGKHCSYPPLPSFPFKIVSCLIELQKQTFRSVSHISVMLLAHIQQTFWRPRICCSRHPFALRPCCVLESTSLPLLARNECAHTLSACSNDDTAPVGQYTLSMPPASGTSSSIQ